MAENKKYYWLKLKRGFFKRHDMEIIEAMPNGKDYVLFYLKLLLESIDHEGALRFNETIPYDNNMLSVITNTNVDIVKSALDLFVGLGMVDILDDATIYMREVEGMIGSTVDNDNANRQRRFREKQKTLALSDDVTKSNASVTVCVTKNNESKSIEKEKESETETEPEIVSADDDPVESAMIAHWRQHGITLTLEQAKDLEAQLSPRVFNRYFNRMQDFLKKNPTARIRSQYDTILSWAREDGAA
ncbi:MAG: phage replisome organizer N-terminal domain-containing protein [Clostridia bacterium]|nr:phage replisome organizer N-terminal domain-containing protein [Clostridia bacterium]